MQYKGETLSGQFPNGCVRYRHKDGIANHGIYFLNNNSNLNNSCGSGQTDCIERIYKATDGTHPKIKNYLKKRYQLIGKDSSIQKSPDTSQSIVDCKIFASINNYDFKGGDTYTHNYEPYGCFLWNENEVFFNNNLKSNGKCGYSNNSAKCVKVIYYDMKPSWEIFRQKMIDYGVGLRKCSW